MVYGAAFLWHLDSFQPVGEPLRHVLLDESLAADAGRITFHGDGAATNVREHHRRDRFVIRRKRPLGDPVVGEQHFVRVSDHGRSLTTSRAVLSVRTPSSRGWRSLSCTVHSVNATWTTISGRTQ